MRRALLVATRDVIRTGLSLNYQTVELMFDGRPPPRSGQFFIAVHRGGRQSISDLCLEEIYQVFVTVTIRINVPIDRVGTDVLEKATQGLDDRVDAIRALLHMNEDVRTGADVIIATQPGGPFNGFIETIRFQGDDPPQLVGSEWFHSAQATECGVAQQLRFGAAVRIQRIGEAS